jgi:hypothetical protein
LYTSIVSPTCKFKNVDDLIDYFGTEIQDYFPSEAGIYINGHFYDNWVEQKMPQLEKNLQLQSFANENLFVVFFCHHFVAFLPLAYYLF